MAEEVVSEELYIAGGRIVAQTAEATGQAWGRVTHSYTKRDLPWPKR